MDKVIPTLGASYADRPETRSGRIPGRRLNIKALPIAPLSWTANAQTDLELRQRVLALLRSHDEPDRFLDQPIVQANGPSWANLARPDGVAEFDPVSRLMLGVNRPAFGESPRRAIDPLAELNPMTEGAGSCIGPYKLLEKIGEGGMGAVYMAEQEQPVRRWVALKIIKPGMDSEQVIARFEAEPRPWP